MIDTANLFFSIEQEHARDILLSTVQHTHSRCTIHTVYSVFGTVLYTENDRSWTGAEQNGMLKWKKKKRDRKREYIGIVVCWDWVRCCALCIHAYLLLNSLGKFTILHIVSVIFYYLWSHRDAFAHRRCARPDIFLCPRVAEMAMCICLM